MVKGMKVTWWVNGMPITVTGAPKIVEGGGLENLASPYEICRSIYDGTFETMFMVKP